MPEINNLPDFDIEINPIRAASIHFTCANCTKEVSNQVPIRYNEYGPYFCTFYCGWRYAGNNGDEKAAANADRIDAIFGRK